MPDSFDRQIAAWISRTAHSTRTAARRWVRRVRVRSRLTGRWVVSRLSQTRGRMFALAGFLFIGSITNLILAWQSLPPSPRTAMKSHIFHVRAFFSFAFTAVGVAIVVIEMAQRQRATRLDRGLCPVCGYDLRATPERCPECGTVMAEYRRS